MPPTSSAPPHDVTDLGLAEAGRGRIEWAEQAMPVLRRLRERFAKEKPLKGVSLAGCLHVTAETAVLLRTLRAGGARVAVAAATPLSTQDDVAAALVRHEGVATFARRAADAAAAAEHCRAVLAAAPVLTLDAGGALVALLHGAEAARAASVQACLEETPSGVMRLRALARDGALGVAAVAVNDAATKQLFENRYGTGQSMLDGLLRATGMLFAGKTIVVAGYGWCGKGVALRARGAGAQVLITEVDPIRALEAAMDGLRVMPMRDACRVGDVFVTLTGSRHVLREEHFQSMRDGAIVCNGGHGDAEIDMPTLRRLARRVERGVRPAVDLYHLPNGRSVAVVGDGRLLNHAAADGHPAAVLDLSCATLALGAAWALKMAGKRKLPVGVHQLPPAIADEVAALKLDTMGVRIDRLTADQRGQRDAR